MGLIYRGVKYEPTQSPIAMAEAEVIGRYRGAALKRRTPKHAPTKHRVQGLKYRGVDVK
ncbi:MAG: DUF4278 domain-containing protein [Pseudanabaenales cyanobacterium]|nr:DUF4278 domain-containing protein [Pseudanabaenales cyanobacterium]